MGIVCVTPWILVWSVVGSVLHEPFWGIHLGHKTHVLLVQCCAFVFDDHSCEVWHIVSSWKLCWHCLGACLHACVFSLICAFFSLHLLVCDFIFFLNVYCKCFLMTTKFYLWLHHFFLAFFFLFDSVVATRENELLAECVVSACGKLHVSVCSRRGLQWMLFCQFSGSFQRSSQIEADLATVFSFCRFAFVPCPT